MCGVSQGVYRGEEKNCGTRQRLGGGRKITCKEGDSARGVLQ